MRIAQPIKFHQMRVGEIQFTPSMPYRETVDNRLKSREGAVYVDIASPLAAEKGGDGNRMDWDNKLTFKLNATELSALAIKARAGLFPIQMVHDNKGVKTTLKIEQGRVIEKGDHKGLMTYRWSIGRSGTYHNIFLNAFEMHQLCNCFDAIQPVLLGWGVDLVKSVVEEIVREGIERLSGSSSVPPAGRYSQTHASAVPHAAPSGPPPIHQSSGYRHG